jgi:3-hydroxybutyryl-CoA dehydrogenase
MTATDSQRNVAVAGAGLMGCGIASVFALAGFDVVVYDADPSALSHVKQNCHAVFLEMAVARVITSSQVAAAQARVRTATSLAELSGAALAIEAIVESAAAKQSLYSGLENVLAETAILASSTSGIVPETLSEGLRRPGRFLIAHFWNPPHIIPLVEVVPGPRTEQGTVVRVMDWLTAANCRPVLLSKAAPGFIGNRLQFAVLREALHMLQAGIADAETIDEVMKQSLGRRYRWIGPLEGADIGGLDTFLAIGSQLLPHLASNDDGLDVLRELVSEKRGGRRDGHGIYAWDVDREVRLSESRLQMLTEALNPPPYPRSGSPRNEIQQ